MRRPLVIMSPKWILRHKLATSSLEELANGEFQTIIGSHLDSAAVERVILCSGKVYYHLFEERTARGLENIALVRIEQLYPFPDTELTEILSAYKNMQSIMWCQEEPINQGAWYSSQHHMKRVIKEINPDLQLTYVGREGSAAPASGYMSVHLEEQNKFIDEALSFDN